MSILTGCLKGGMSGKDTIDITFFPAYQFLNFLGITIGGSLDEFFSQVSRNMCFK